MTVERCKSRAHTSPATEGMAIGFEVLVVGCGAIGSRVAAALPPDVIVTCVDHERVASENVGVSLVEDSDVGAPKAEVAARSVRAAGRRARALVGDVRYALRPGLARAVDAVLIALDNPRALHDAAVVLWAVSRPVPVLVLTCGGPEGGWQVRVFAPPAAPCMLCFFGSAERTAERLAERTTCAAASAPRAGTVAAAGAARAGIEALARWRSGERSLAGCRIQFDGSGEPFTVRMPAGSPRCPIGHSVTAEPQRVEDLGGSIGEVTVGALVARAAASAGSDAELLLGRRGVPYAGLYCPRCGAFGPAQSRMLPAAIAAARPCGCDVEPRPLGIRDLIGIAELDSLATLTLAEWGAGHGEELAAVGRDASVRLRCGFAWGDLDG